MNEWGKTVLTEAQRIEVVQGKVQLGKKDEKVRVLSRNVEDALFEAQAKASYEAGGEAGKKGGGKWTWELPDLEVQKDLGYQQYQVEKNDTLNNSSFNNDPLQKTVDTLNTREAVLGMPVEKAASWYIDDRVLQATLKDWGIKWR